MAVINKAATFLAIFALIMSSLLMSETQAQLSLGRELKLPLRLGPDNPIRNIYGKMYDFKHGKTGNEKS